MFGALFGASVGECLVLCLAETLQVPSGGRPSVPVPALALVHVLAIAAV